MLILDGTSTRFTDDEKIEQMWSPRKGRGGDLVFYPGCNKNTKRMNSKPRMIVIHWVGSENKPEQVKNTLEARNLSIHFTLDQGSENRRRIVQMADPLLTRCAHAGGFANDSIGIEMVSRGFATKDDLTGSDLVDRSQLDWDEPRDVYEDRIDGRRVRLASYYPEALHDLVWLVETLCYFAKIPRIVPFIVLNGIKEVDEYLDAQWSQLRAEAHPVQLGEGKFALPLFDRDTSRTMKGRSRSFQGVIGHFHVHPDKMDPGTQPFLSLWSEGFNPKGEKFPRTL